MVTRRTTRPALSMRNPPLLDALLCGKRLVRFRGGGIGNHADLSGAAYASPARG